MKNLALLALLVITLAGCVKEKLEQVELCKLQHTGSILVNNNTSVTIDIVVNGETAAVAAGGFAVASEVPNGTQTVVAMYNGSSAAITVNVIECDVVAATFY